MHVVGNSETVPPLDSRCRWVGLAWNGRLAHGEYTMLQLIVLVLVVVGIMKLCGIKPPKWLWSFNSFKRTK